MSSSRQAALSDVIGHLGKADCVHVRMAMRLSADEQWIAQSLVVDVFPQEWVQSAESPLRNGDMPAYLYDYGRFLFVAGLVASGEARNWFAQPTQYTGQEEYEITGMDRRPGFASRIIRFHMPRLYGTALATRFPSHAQDGLVTLPWPHTLYDCAVAVNDTVQSGETDFLVNDGCPFFPDFRTAVATLVHGVKRIEQAQSYFPRDMVDVRVIHAEGWLDYIRVTPTEVAITIGGMALAGSRIALAGAPEAEREIAVFAPGTVSFPLVRGLPAQVWAVLSRGDTWMDYATLGTRWSPFGETPGNVRIEPGDLAGRIQEIISGGEGQTTEFKEAIPRPHDQLLKTVAAFANGEGGVILVGVKDRSGELVGVKKDEIPSMVDQLTDIVRKNVTPEPKIRIEVCEVDHRHIVALFVEAGEQHPYGIRPDNPSYYVRRGATTFPARPEEIRAMVLRTESAVPDLPF